MKFQLGFNGERFIYLPLSVLNNINENPLISDLYIYSIGYFSKANYHYIDRPNGCDQFLLIICKDGKGKVNILDKEYTLSANQFIILPPNIKHRYKADLEKPWSIYWFHFKGFKAEHIFNEKKCFFKIGKIDLQSMNKCFNLFEEIYSILKQELTRINLIRANYCFTYLISCLIYEETNETHNYKSEYNGSIINRSIYYMNQNINNNISLEEISHFLNYSPSHFYRKFIKEIGMSPMKYFKKMKIEKACTLLNKSNLKINQISSLLGYKDPLYFSRVFSKEKGVSPEKFREIK